MNNRQKITIDEKEFQIGFSFRAAKIYQDETGKTIDKINGTWDELVYVYCSLKALNPEFTYTLDQFVDLLDADPQLFIDLQFGLDTGITQQQTENEQKKRSSLKVALTLWMLSLFVWVAPVLIPVIFGSIWIFRSLKALVRLMKKIGKKRA